MIKSFREWLLYECDELSESASVYKSKLHDFIKNQSDDEQKFIKQVLNNIFLGLKKDGDDYVEGKRPTIKDFGDYKQFIMKIQTKTDITENGNHEKDIILRYCKNIKNSQIGYDSQNYWHAITFNNGTQDKESVKISVDEIGYPHSFSNRFPTAYGGKALDKTLKGYTYEVIVTVPVSDEKNALNNISSKYLTRSKKGFQLSNGYVDSDGKSFVVSFENAENELSIHINTEGSADVYHIYYKSGAKARKAFFALIDIFNGRTTYGECEDFIKKQGVGIGHSYYFNPWTD